MTTTLDRAKLAIPLLQAIVEGKTLQNAVGISWIDCSFGAWLLHEVIDYPEHFRIKTEEVEAP